MSPEQKLTRYYGAILMTVIVVLGLFLAPIFPYQVTHVSGQNIQNVAIHAPQVTFGNISCAIYNNYIEVSAVAWNSADFDVYLNGYYTFYNGTGVPITQANFSYVIPSQTKDALSSTYFTVVTLPVYYCGATIIDSHYVSTTIIYDNYTIQVSLLTLMQKSFNPYIG